MKWIRSAHPSAEAYNELGSLLEQLGEMDLASTCFRTGLQLAPGCKSTVPVSVEHLLPKSKSEPKDKMAGDVHESEDSALSSTESEAVTIPEELQTKVSS